MSDEKTGVGGLSASAAMAIALAGIGGLGASMLYGFHREAQREGPFDGILRSLIVERGEARTVIAGIISMVRDSAITMGRWNTVRRRRGMPRILRYTGEYVGGGIRERTVDTATLLGKAIDDANVVMPRSPITSNLVMAIVAVGQGTLGACIPGATTRPDAIARKLGRAVTLIIQAREAALEEHYMRILPEALGATADEVAGMTLRAFPADIAREVVAQYEAEIGGETHPAMPFDIIELVLRGRDAVRVLKRTARGRNAISRINTAATKKVVASRATRQGA